MQDWIWLDALFRSRSFDLPYSGPSMTPCLDLANHSTTNNALWQQDPDTKAVILKPREGCTISSGDEVTISYGKDKPAAEMLFNYGFIDASSSTQSLVLPLDGMLPGWQKGDPFLEDKLHFFGKAPLLEFKIDEKGVPRWIAPFLYLLCVTERDGLGFGVQDGGRWAMLWNGRDITRIAGMFDVFINAQEIRETIQHRTMVIVKGVAERQLEQMRRSEKKVKTAAGVRETVRQAVLQLREIETDILERCQEALKEKVDRLPASSTSRILTGYD